MFCLNTRVIEVLWHPPLSGRYKCNTDGASVGNSEDMGVILAIQHAYAQNWPHLWIESDSKLVSFAFKSSSIIP
ncbi:ribonuclease H protein [Trifolium medium]|uniref:Ribonuclease H protein n=1 Tax=Trifolium medium TaxID=97028 RepID=A0A392QUH5_9FABA|nr:ribonuclease H protein [Trifolium medium]